MGTHGDVVTNTGTLPFWGDMVMYSLTQGPYYYGDSGNVLTNTGIKHATSYHAV